MLDKKIFEIEKFDSVLDVSGKTSLNFNGIDIDTRILKPGNLFVAINSGIRDGNDFRMQALEKGALGIISERPQDEIITGAEFVYIQVNDIVSFLKEFIIFIRTKHPIPAIAITGTCGKTSVKEYLTELLSAKHNVLKSPKSYNNLYGLALTLASITTSTEIAVLECGTNNPGEIKVLSELIKPEVMIITNVGEGHLENFKTLQGVLEEKTSITSGAKEGSFLYLNADDAMLKTYENKRGIKTISYGFGDGADHKICPVEYGEDTTIFEVDKDEYKTTLVGKHNVYNLTAAILVAQRFGMSPNDINIKLKDMRSFKLRFEKKRINNVNFINDCYNANPLSFSAAVAALVLDSSIGRKIVVAGDMLELGEDSDALHKRIGKEIYASGIDYLFSYGEKGKLIAEGAFSAGMDKQNVLSFSDMSLLVSNLKGILNYDDIVLIKGSRKLKMEGIIECFITSCIR